MPSFNEYIVNGNPWLFFPVAIFLGALHGLEPGHSKTMMTAYIVAIRGTVWQAFLLGLSATISHTAIIWILAFVGLRYSASLNVEELEPYFQLVTGIMVIGLAGWMLYRTNKAQKVAKNHEHGNGKHGGMIIDTGHGLVEISVFETNVSPRFRIYGAGNQTVILETIRPNGIKQKFNFLPQQDFLEATEHLPEPHEFQAVLELKHGEHSHSYKVNFVEHHHDSLSENSHEESEDAHERAHRMELEKNLNNKPVTNGQIILFGLTGGLLPCPSAFAVLLICLQLKKVALGFAMVLAFSIGLAVTLITVGSIAAVSVKHAIKKFKGFNELARKLPYASSTIMLIIGLLVSLEGLKRLMF